MKDFVNHSNEGDKKEKRKEKKLEKGTEMLLKMSGCYNFISFFLPFCLISLDLLN